jgi:hypothetical protein
VKRYYMPPLQGLGTGWIPSYKHFAPYGAFVRNDTDVKHTAICGSESTAPDPPSQRFGVAGAAAAAETEQKSVQQLSWRGFAVRKNGSNRRRKLFNAGTRHDDTVTTAVSFLSDAQEPAALVFTELDVEVLALNLQFFRLDDVVHFALRARV